MIGHLPYSSGIAPLDFSRFPKLKLDLSKKKCSTKDDIITFWIAWIFFYRKKVLSVFALRALGLRVVTSKSDKKNWQKSVGGWSRPILFLVCLTYASSGYRTHTKVPSTHEAGDYKCIELRKIAQIWWEYRARFFVHLIICRLWRSAKQVLTPSVAANTSNADEVSSVKNDDLCHHFYHLRNAQITASGPTNLESTSAGSKSAAVLNCCVPY